MRVNLRPNIIVGTKCCESYDTSSAYQQLSGQRRSVQTQVHTVSHVITFNLDGVNNTDGAGDAVKARAYDDHIPLIARIDRKNWVTVKLGTKHNNHLCPEVKPTKTEFQIILSKKKKKKYRHLITHLHHSNKYLRDKLAQRTREIKHDLLHEHSALTNLYKSCITAP